MGKSTVINLLVQTWRHAGRRVIITAASAKAARLINGYTVHSAFWLLLNGAFNSQGNKKCTDQFI